MIRPIPLRRYLSVMNAKGYATARVFDGTALEVESLDSPHYLIEAGQYHRVVENMISLTGGEGLGLDVGLVRDIKDFGVLGYAALACRTVRQSAEEFWGRHGDALGMMARIVIPRGNSETVSLQIDASPMSPLAYRFFVEEALCLLTKVGAQVSGVEPQLSALRFSYPRPRYAARYREIFHCPMKFDCADTQATLSRSWLEMPLQASDPEFIQLYQQHLEQLRQQIDASSPLASRLRSLFIQRNGVVPPLAEAARELGLSPRTFRRQLQQQGHSYRKAVTEFRSGLALDYLKSGNAAAKQLSDHVGFKDVNAFRRAFKGWTGKTIREYRAGTLLTDDNGR
jgi:AraC-like DNA-binding protein